MPTSQARVVSLIASATEIVAALDCGRQLVGRSHECDHPADLVAPLPALTRPKFPVTGSSGDIDRRVREIVAQGLSVYHVDAEALRELEPDLIVTQDHCEVCAVSLSDVEAAVCAWSRPGVKIVSLRPDALEDVYSDIRTVAAALNVSRIGENLVADMHRRFAGLATRSRRLARPRVAFIEWGEPLMSGGNWMPPLIEMAGGHNLFGKAGGKSEVLAWHEVVSANPEVIIIAPCGFDLDASRREQDALARHPSWAELKAVREGRVYCADGNAYFNRPGPRLADTAEIIAEILHPRVFAFGHEGVGWIRHA